MSEIDSLEIQLEVSAKSSLSYLDKVEKKIDDITESLRSALLLSKDFGNFGNIDFRGIKSVNKQLKSISEQTKKISSQTITPKVKTKEVEKAAKSIDDLFDKFQNAGRNLDLSNIGLSDLEKEADRTEKTVKRLNDRLEKKMSLEGTENLGKSWESLVYDIQKATNQAEIYREAIDKIRNSAPKFTIERGDNDTSSEPEAPQKRFISPESLNYDPEAMKMVFGEEAEGLKNFDDVLKKFGGTAAEASIKLNELEEEFNPTPVNTYEAQIKRLKAELSNLASQGFKQGDSEYDEVAKELARVTLAKRNYDKEMSRSVQTDAGTNKFLSNLKSIDKNIRSTTSLLAKFGKSASKSLSAVTKTINNIKNALIGTQKQANGMSFGRMIGSSVAFSFVFQGISAVQNAIKEGSDNLVQYSSVYNNSISSMVSALTYLKNAWASAFSPIINVVAPHIQAFIDMLASALNALGRFLAALTGKTTTIQAKKVWQDYGASLSEVGKGAGDAAKGISDATKAAKEFQTYTLGIDELNIQPQSDNGLGSENGGSGGATGGTGVGELLPSDMFETVEVEKSYIDSLYELGEHIGNALTKSLNSINWDKVYQGARNFGKGLADFLNGLISPELFGSVGRTIAGALNTAIYAALSFGETFDFYDFGVSIATGINEFFNTFDFASFAQTLNVWVDGIIETITAAIKNIKWGDVWERIKDFFGNLELDTAIVLSVAIAPVALTGITKIVDSISVMGEVLSPILGLISPLEGIFGSGGLFATASAPILALIGVVTLLAAGLGYVFATNEQVRTSFQSAISTIGENFTPILQYITETIIPDLKTGWEEFVNILTPFGEFLESVFVSIWQDMLNPALSYMGETVLPKLLEVFKNLWENVLVPVGNFIGSVLSPVIEILSSVLSFLWNNVIVPLAKAIGNSLGKAFEGACDILNDRVIPIVNGVIDVFQFLWNNVFSPLITFLWGTFQPVFKRVFDAIEGIINGLSQSFGGLIDFITGVFSGNWEKAWNGIKDIFGGVFNGILSIVGTVVNGIIDGVNWVADKIGIGKLLDNWEVPKFAKGTSGIPKDTLGVVNDQPGSTYKELIVPPSGKPFIPEGRNVMLPLEKGTKIMPAKQTKAFMSGMPHFAGGIGDFFGDLWSGIKEFAGNVWDYISNPGELVKIALDKFISMSNFFEPWTSIAGGIINKMFDSIADFVKGLFDKAMPEVNYNPSAGVEQWRNLAAKALQMTGQYSASNLNLLLYQMQTESGGNPNAINDWDINAKNGTPSKGLMQVIDPTFKAYAYPGYDKNIYDPLSNMLAAIRYTLSRYGSLANGWKGHGYASGIGKINLSDLIPAYEVGGFPEDGLFFANHNELVGRFDNGRTAVANNTNIQSGIKEGVKEAVAEILAPYLQQIAQNTRETADKDFNVDVDGRSLVSAYDRRKTRNGYSFTG